MLTTSVSSTLMDTPGASTELSSTETTISTNTFTPELTTFTESSTETSTAFTATSTSESITLINVPLQTGLYKMLRKQICDCSKV